jgi:hypothetical protein
MSERRPLLPMQLGRVIIKIMLCKTTLFTLTFIPFFNLYYLLTLIYSVRMRGFIERAQLSMHKAV